MKKIYLIAMGVILFFASMIIIVNNINNNKQYLVTFDSKGGTIVESIEVKKNESISRPEDPTMEGYQFIEWTYNGETYDFSSEVTGNITLVAKWQKLDEEVETFTIKFNSNGGTTIANKVVEKGNKIKKPEDPIKVGYQFIEWQLNGVKYDFELEVTGDLELVAIYEEIKPVSKPSADTNNKPNNNQSNNAGATTKPTTPTTPSEPTTPTVKKYTVTFNSNGGSAVNSQTITEGSKATKPSNPTKSGYNFAGWELNGSTYDFNSAVNSNITLVAKWAEIVKKKYTVSFDSNGGSAVSSQTIVEGNKVAKPSDPIKEGYNFAGWTLNGSNYNFSSSVNSNITLIANWNQKNYTIKISAKDDYTPARILTVYEDGKQITVKEIRYTNGTYLCSGEYPQVDKKIVAGQTSFTVVLKSGLQVTAKVS